MSKKIPDEIAFYEVARTNYASKKYALAKTQFQRLLSTSADQSTLVNANYMMALCFIQEEKNYPKAFHHCKKACAIQWDEEAFLILTMQAVSAGYCADAKAVVDQALQEQKYHSELHQAIVYTAMVKLDKLEQPEFSFFPWPKLRLSHLYKAAPHYLPAFALLITELTETEDFHTAEQEIKKFDLSAFDKSELSPFEKARTYQSLGVFYSHSQNKRFREIKKAIACFEKALKLNDFSVVPRLIQLHSGEHPEQPKDAKKVIHFLQYGADQQHPDCLYNLGVHYRNGDGVPKDREKATRYLMQAINAGCNQIQAYDTALFLLEEGEKMRDTAFGILSEQPQNPQAQFMILLLQLPLKIYFNGEKILFQADDEFKIPSATAKIAIKKLASMLQKNELPSPEISYLMALYYQFGTGEENKAITNYRFSADHGMINSYNNLCYIYCQRTLRSSTAEEKENNTNCLFNVLNSRRDFFGIPFPGNIAQLLGSSNLQTLKVLLQIKQFENFSLSNNIVSLCNDEKLSPKKKISALAAAMKYQSLGEVQLHIILQHIGKLAAKVIMDPRSLYPYLNDIFSVIAAEAQAKGKTNWGLMQILINVSQLQIQLADIKLVAYLQSVFSEILSRINTFNADQLLTILVAVKKMDYTQKDVVAFTHELIRYLLPKADTSFTDINSRIKWLYNLAVLDNYHDFSKIHDHWQQDIKPVLTQMTELKADAIPPGSAQSCYFALHYFKLQSPLLKDLEEKFAKTSLTTQSSKFQLGVTTFIRRNFCTSGDIQCVEFTTEKSIGAKPFDLFMKLIINDPASDGGQRVVLIAVEADGGSHFLHPPTPEAGEPIYRLKELFFHRFLKDKKMHILRIRCYKWELLATDKMRYEYIQTRFAKLNVPFPAQRTDQSIPVYDSRFNFNPDAKVQAKGAGAATIPPTSRLVPQG